MQIHADFAAKMQRTKQKKNQKTSPNYNHRHTKKKKNNKKSLRAEGLYSFLFFFFFLNGYTAMNVRKCKACWLTSVLRLTAFH